MFLPGRPFLWYLHFPLQLSEQHHHQAGGDRDITKETGQRDEREARDSESGREEGDGENPDFNFRGGGLSSLVANQYKCKCNNNGRRRNGEDSEHAEGGDVAV